MSRHERLQVLGDADWPDTRPATMASTKVSPVDFSDLTGDEEAPTHPEDDGDLAPLATPERRESAARARRTSNRRRSSAALEPLVALADAVDDELEDESARDEPERRGSTFDEVRDTLDDNYRRMSQVFGGGQEQDNKARRTALHRAFDEFLERLERDSVREPDAVARLMQVWQAETFGRATDPLARLQLGITRGLDLDTVIEHVADLAWHGLRAPQRLSD